VRTDVTEGAESMTTTERETERTTTTERTTSREHADLVETLARHRYFLRNTLRDLTDEQARQRTTVSELTLGGLIKHVTITERRWIDFIRSGPTAMDRSGLDWEDGFRMNENQTLAELLDAYQQVADDTDALVATLDLDADHPLPEAPWFEPGARWSARRVLLHMIAETSQHAGHADIIRESLDGAKSMG
jgi:uncharacterized damage-inducible protein DinB